MEKIRIWLVDFQIQYASKNQPAYWLKVILQIRSYSAMFGEQKKYFSCPNIDLPLSSSLYITDQESVLINFFNKETSQKK